MCYDISFQVAIKELADYFPDLIFNSQIEINFDTTHIMGHAHAEHPIIYADKENRLNCRLMQWGIIPFYIKDEKQYAKQRASMLNARAERILNDSKSYWYKIRNRRCLIPVSGIYEHRAIKGWKKKVPYFIKLKNENLFFLPGLYSVAELPDTETGEILQRWTYTMITREANELMKQIHNSGNNKSRMPLFLDFNRAKQFVNNNLSIEEYEKILNFEIDSEELNYRPVYTIRTSKLRPDGEDKDKYWEWENLPELEEMNS